MASLFSVQLTVQVTEYLTNIFCENDDWKFLYECWGKSRQAVLLHFQ